MEENNKEEENNSRRSFLKMGLLAGGALVAGGVGVGKVFSRESKGQTNKKTTVFTSDGKAYNVGDKHLEDFQAPPVTNEEARKGIPGKKFVMVIDLAKCDGCKKCTQACQKMHYTPSDREWIKVYDMKDSEASAPYFFPKPCFHCDDPICTKVCPVNATFKRQDGIVLIDNERCIGCRSCMAACPYSTRYFNWSRPDLATNALAANTTYTPERSIPRRMGTVEKCDFCPDMLREGKMPGCVTGCPMDALYFGDQNEDAVTNASGVTVKLSQLLEDNAAYRYLEELGTEPRVYYLPPKNRKYPKPNMNGEGEDEKGTSSTNSTKTDNSMDGMQM